MTQAPATPELVERLRDELHVMQGDGFAALLATTSEAADALEAQQARIAELGGLLDLHAAMQSEVERAQAAEEASQALADRYEKALREACDLLAERTYGSPARSPGHNARLTLEAALSSQGRREGGERFAENAKSSRSQPCGVGPSDLTDPQSQHSDGGRDDA